MKAILAGVLIGICLPLVAFHLVLNWHWLTKVAASKHIRRLAAGILSGLLIVIAFLLLPVEGGSVATLELRRSLAIASAKLDRRRAEQTKNEAME